MKKHISLLVAAVMGVAVASADVALGVRGTAQWGLGTTVDNFDGSELDLSRMWMFGGFLYGKIPVSVVENLYVQPELGFTHRIAGFKWNDMKYALTYNAIALPVLIAYDFPITQAFSVTVEGGPQFSVAMGRMRLEDKDGSELANADPESRILFSGIIGAGVSYAFSSGTAAIFDMRYDLGFNKLEFENSDTGLFPRGLSFSAGFQVKF